MATLDAVIEQILKTRTTVGPERSVLVAITGIDACGKGHVTAQIERALGIRGLHAASLKADGWLNLPEKRFAPTNSGEHFYLNAIRFDEMFAGLVMPLRDRRSLRFTMDYVEETAREYRRHIYEFADVDVILLEGILLLKKAFQTYYDCSVWIDCSFDTALKRAIGRAQEGLPPEETIKAYRTIYFPAQEIHLQRDNPRSAATMLLNNDPQSF
jgi:uridine kinase